MQWVDGFYSQRPRGMVLRIRCPSNDCIFLKLTQALAIIEIRPEILLGISNDRTAINFKKSILVDDEQTCKSTSVDQQ
jgi:hypothetical protein